MATSGRCEHPCGIPTSTDWLAGEGGGTSASNWSGSPSHSSSSLSAQTFKLVQAMPLQVATDQASAQNAVVQAEGGLVAAVVVVDEPALSIAAVPRARLGWQDWQLERGQMECFQPITCKDWPGKRPIGGHAEWGWLAKARAKVELKAGRPTSCQHAYCRPPPLLATASSSSSPRQRRDARECTFIAYVNTKTSITC